MALHEPVVEVYVYPLTVQTADPLAPLVPAEPVVVVVVVFVTDGVPGELALHVPFVDV
ncbi:MAG TPA: hypothetical protein VM124_01180 [Candidatus Limnocylindrales bacterium]|nr:hypothetical protein [Candidatus Limnocylindrales bacterium]